jgi:phage/plasmid-associated DNA primase
MRNNKKLYESIMKDVAKTLKNKLNESNTFTDNELKQYYEESEKNKELADNISDFLDDFFSDEYEIEILFEDPIYVMMFYDIYMKRFLKTYSVFNDQATVMFVTYFVNNILLKKYNDFKYYDTKKLVAHVLNYIDNDNFRYNYINKIVSKYLKQVGIK